jgi:hypothetical protein
MRRAVVAGFAYVGPVFALGFTLGTLRVLVVQPHVGSAVAVLIELPIMLSVSWIVCRTVMFRLAVPPRWRDRLAVGAVAFALLMLAEAGVSMLGFGRSLAEHLTTYRTPGAFLGLLAQAGFALFPSLQLGIRRVPTPVQADHGRRALVSR